MKINVTMAHRAWLTVTTEPLDHPTLQAALPLLEDALGPLARWFGYDGEDLSITIELVRDRPEGEVFQEVVALIDGINGVQR
jgi:hypothetical protein